MLPLAGQRGFQSRAEALGESLDSLHLKFAPDFITVTLHPEYQTELNPAENEVKGAELWARQETFHPTPEHSFLFFIILTCQVHGDDIELLLEK